MAREKRKPPEGEGGAPGWVVTYGDMMSLLLTFFILLAAFSTISEEDFKKAIGSLEGAFSVFPQYPSVIDAGGVGKKRELQRKMQQAAQKLAEQIQIMGQDKQVKVEYDAKGGIKITLRDTFLFDRGSADIKSESIPVLESVSKILKGLDNVFIEVKGHTDNVPIVNHPKFQDNYELSYYRASAVVKQLQNLGPLPNNLFEITACGPNQPLSTNLTEEGRRENRRVEIFVRGFLDPEKKEQIEKGTL